MPESSDGYAGGAEGLIDEAEDLVIELESESETLLEDTRRLGWLRLDYAIFGGLAAIVALYCLAFFALGLDFEKMRTWGYAGIFFLAMAGSATIVLPTPSNLAVFGSGVVLNPVIGIPPQLLVGLIAGLGDAIGEFSGYGLGLAGAELIRRRRIYRLFEGWMLRRGMLAIFLLCTFPNPFFDLAGAAAGATRMPARKFFVATLGGKIIKDLFLAYGGTFSIGLLSRFV
ncbi:MAG TPA: VTT domain-containing protein [Dehalococcoidia bacterium]|jgi:membrane protein DedA with SNARE-associated domain